MRELFQRVFGTSRSRKRYVWYWVVIPAVFAFVSSHGKSVTSFLYGYIGIYVFLLFLFISMFFLDWQGSKIVKAWFHLRRLKKTLDPVALAVSAEITSRCDVDSSQYYHYYKFPDGNFITLTIWGEGFNVFQPNWNPGHEKDTAGLGILMRAIANTRESESENNSR